MKSFLYWLLLTLTLFDNLPRAFAQTTAFTYQGRLQDGATNASGTYTMTFKLYDAAIGGNQVGTVITNNGVSVTNGLFSTLMDFGGGAFTGSRRWLEFAINGTTLAPRTELTPTPYAIQAVTAVTALTAGVATSANSVSSTNIIGTIPDARLSSNVALLTGSANFAGAVTATAFNGNGAGLTNLSVPAASLTGTLTASQIPALDAAKITSSTFATARIPNLDGSKITSGTVTDARLSANMPFLNGSNTFTGTNIFSGVVMATNTRNQFVGNGAGLTNLNAANLGGVIAPANIGGGTITGTMLAADSVTAAKISSGQVVKSLNGLTDAVTLSAGANITITPSGTNVQISAAASGGLAWQVVSGTYQQAQPNAGYVATNDSLVTITLPTAPNVGDILRVSGSGSGGWKIAQNAGQSILAANLELTVGANWTAREFPRDWYSVASSDDGNKLVAGVYGGQIYTSTDSGTNWTARESSRGWYSVASSADGTKLVAVVRNGQIYTSTSSGVSWTARDSSRNWSSVASSGDGSKLVAGVSGGQIYTSTNSGVSWTARDSSRNWSSVASSADGSKLVAVVRNGQIYTSTNSGVSWTARDSSRNWSSVASSADGSKMAAVGFYDQIYISTDSGTNWLARESARSWDSVASSVDGNKLVAVEFSGQIYTSTDSGTNWVARESARNWNSVASSADGNKLVAVEYSGQIYTSNNQLTPSSTTALGTAGYLTGGQFTAIELQYIGNDQFLPLSWAGKIVGY